MTEDSVVTHPKTITDVDFVVVPDEELEKPYRVIIENDDVTPMDFVIAVLCLIFELSPSRATKVMLQAHYFGRAHVTTLPYEEARQRVYDAHSLARASGYPLKFYLEPDE